MRKKPGRTFRPRLEVLEDRSLPSSVRVIDGVLDIRGSNGSDNVYVRSLSSGGQSYLQARVNGGWTTVNAVGINRIFVATGDGSDTIVVETNVNIPADLVGGNGNDRIWGGNGPDRLYGAGGNDYLNGRGGNDILYGQGGYDVLVGGPGRDYLDGGTQRDSIYRRPGVDQVAPDFSTVRDRLLFDRSDPGLPPPPAALPAGAYVLTPRSDISPSRTTLSATSSEQTLLEFHTDTPATNGGTIYGFRVTGTFTGSLRLYRSDPNNPNVNVPVAFTEYFLGGVRYLRLNTPYGVPSTSSVRWNIRSSGGLANLELLAAEVSGSALALVWDADRNYV